MTLLCLAHHVMRLWLSPRRWPRGATKEREYVHVYKIESERRVRVFIRAGVIARKDSTERKWTRE